MSTKTVTLLLALLLVLVAPFTIAAAPQSDPATNPACDAAQIIDRLYQEIRANKTTWIYVLSDMLVFHPWEQQLVESTLRSIQYNGLSGPKTLEGLTETLNQAGYKRWVIHNDTQYWRKPDDWKDPCSNGGGGGTSLQHANAYVWLLVALTLLAVLTVAGRRGMRLLPI